MEHKSTKNTSSTPIFLISSESKAKFKLPEFLTNRYKFSSDRFNINEIINDPDIDVNEIQKYIKECEKGKIITNEYMMHILTKCISVLVYFSNSLSNFDQECGKFPQTILELQTFIHNACNLPNPIFNEIQIHQAPKSEILGKDSILINAPLIYTTFLQQKRIDESIKFVINCLNNPQLSEIKTTKKWVEKICQELKHEIQEKIMKMKIESYELKNELLKLISFNLERDAVDIFIELATHSLKEKIKQDPINTLENVELISFTLCNEINKCISFFMDSFSKKYFYIIIAWAEEQLEENLPLFNSSKFYKNFNLVKDSIKISKKYIQMLEEVGLSCTYLLDYPYKIFHEMLNFSLNEHIKDIISSVLDECFELNFLQNKDESKLSSRSLTCFTQSLSNFMNEIEIFYCKNIFNISIYFLKNIVLSYQAECIKQIEVSNFTLPKLHSILSYVIISESEIKNSFNEFERITSIKYPLEEMVFNEIILTKEQIIQKIVSKFTLSLLNKIPKEIKKKKHQKSKLLLPIINEIKEFYLTYNLPQNLKDKTDEEMIEQIIIITQKIIECKIKKSQKKSFVTYSEYFIENTRDIFNETINKTFRKRIKSMQIKLFS